MSDPPLKFLRIAAVTSRVGLGARTVLRLVEAGSFPPPVHPSPGTVAWIEAEVDLWMRARVTERDRKLAS